MIQLCEIPHLGLLVLFATKETRMALMAYLLVMLVAGVSLGSSLGFLMTARNNRLPESRQCLVFAAAALVLLGCAAVLQGTSGSVPVDPLNNAFAVVRS